jgi:hypothetical protein
MKIALLLLLCLCAPAIGLPATPAQTQSSYQDPFGVMTQDVEVLAAEMQSRLEQDRLMEPPGYSALDILRTMRDRNSNHPKVLALTRILFVRMLDKGRVTMRARAFERCAQWLQAAREVGAGLDGSDSALDQAETELSTARQQQSDFEPGILQR